MQHTPRTPTFANRIQHVKKQLHTPEDLGDLDKVKRVVKLVGFVNCVDGFTGQPKVVNGASDLFAEVRWNVLSLERASERTLGKYDVPAPSFRRCWVDTIVSNVVVVALKLASVASVPYTGRYPF